MDPPSEPDHDYGGAYPQTEVSRTRGNPIIQRWQLCTSQKYYRY